MSQTLPWMLEMRSRLGAPAPRRLVPGEARQAAVLVPLYVDAGMLWTLLTKRTDSLPHHRGQVAFPGGGKEMGEDSWGAALRAACLRLAAAGVRVALFIDPEPAQIDAAAECGVPVIELHTGVYAESSGQRQAQELRRLEVAARHAAARGLEVHAGHGLNYHNVAPVAAIRDIVELNIGHAIVARSVFEGLPAAVRAMKATMLAAR